MDHHEDECRIEGESNSKQDDEEAVARLEEIKKSIEAKMALRQSNLNPERPDPGFFRTLDSSIKRNTAVIKKLKQINEEQREALMDDLRSVNLSKFVSEAVAAISEAKLRSSDIQAAVQTVEEKEVKPVLFENMKEEEVNRCQIQEWYPKFKSVSIKTLIHQLPESFIQYLLDDSGPFLLPVSVLNEDALPNRIHNPDEEEDFQVSEGSDDEAKESSPPPTFPELELKIKESIESLGGAVFPKLNWSAPKDSAWISTAGTLQCATFSEIALLFRASDSLVHDLCHAYDSCHDKSSSRPQNFFLALRKWYPSLQPDMEFRCFVRGQKLVGISQREVTTFYPILLEKKSSLLLLIQGFFNNYVRAGFVSENYTFDVYITKDERVKVVDFNPWGAFTLPLLFTWDELEHIHSEGDDVEFRIVEDPCAVRPGLKTAVPYDYLDTSQGSGWDQFLRNADEELQRQTRSTEAGA